MLEPTPGLRSSFFGRASLVRRIRENLSSLWTVRWVPHPAAEAPIHLLDERRPRGSAGAQLGSTCLHLAVSAALVLLALGPAQERGKSPLPRYVGVETPLKLPGWLRTSGTPGRPGSSGGDSELPATAGPLPPTARLALVPPHAPDRDSHPLVVPVTIEQADAPDLVEPVDP